MGQKTDPENDGEPFGPFSGIEECVVSFSDDPEVDDPESLCREMKRNPREFFGNFEAADSMLQNVKVTFVSGVDVPAQDSQFVMAKNDNGDHGLNVESESDWSRRDRPLVITKEEDDEEDDDADVEQKTWAPVLIPDEVDKQGDLVPKGEIERAAHEFLKNFGNIDTDHNLLSGKGAAIESWTLKEDTTFTMPDGSESREYPKGTWMLGIEWSDEAWKRIEEGELTGLSIFGEAQALDIDELAQSAGGGESSGPIEMGSVELGKAVSEEEHQAISAVIDTFLSEAASETPTLGELVAWLDESDQPDDAEALLRDILGEFIEAVDASEEVPVGDFVGWLANELEESQTEEEEASVERRSVAASVKELHTTAKSMSDPDNEGGDGDGEEPTLKDIKESIDSTTEAVESVKDSQESIREDVNENAEAIAELREKAEESDPEDPEGSEAEGGDGEGDGEGESEKGSLTEERVEELIDERMDSFEDSLKETVTESVEESSEKALAKSLGLEADELPEDEEERAEVIRKARHETESPGDDSNPVGKRSASGEVVMDEDSIELEL